MAGIYIHIPFCKQKCSYCDFYTVVAPTLINNFVESLLAEIRLRKNYLDGAGISTIYFGGGTPSILNETHFQLIFNQLYYCFKIDINAEITIETNPDDLSVEYLRMLQSLPFNRISIGIQSFNNEELKNINRRHTSEQAIKAVKNSANEGFSNISIDLIYGLPNQSLENWKFNIEKCIELDVNHVSVYGLTYEPGTPLFMQKNKGLINPTNDEVMIEMHKLMMHKMRDFGYEYYEISNYAKPGYRSKHNSSYWKFIPYLGLGPSAHSFDGKSRQWNISSIKKYCDNITQNKPFYEQEFLSLQEMYNDYIIVSLRTCDGINLTELLNRFGSEYLEFFNKISGKYLNEKFVENFNSNIRLTENGIFLSDQIIMNLMKTD